MQKQSPKKYKKITISFTDADNDIVDFVKELKRSSKASEFIREAIREKIEKANSKNELMNTNSSIENIDEIIKRIGKLESIITKSDLRPLTTSEDKLSKKQTTELIKSNEFAPKGKSKEKIKENETKNSNLDSNMVDALDYFDF